MGQVQGIPEGLKGATPYLCCEDAAAALDFYAEAFGAVETVRFAEPSGRIGHAEFKVGDAVVMLSDEIRKDDATFAGGQRSSDFFSNLRERVLFQVACVTIKLADAFGELVGRHGVFVVHPAERLLVEVQLRSSLLDFAFAGSSLRVTSPSVCLHLVQQVGADGQQSQPASPRIWSTLRKLAPMTCVL